MTQIIDGISDILDQFDVILTDQWGVLHDGITPYDGVLAALHVIAARQKPVVVISNSGKRSDHNIRRMTALGIDRNLYVDMLTSGESAARLLTSPEGLAEFGRHCFLISNKGDRSMLADVPVDVVSEPEIASFMLMAGSDAPEMDQEDYRPILQRAMAAGLPAICSNPDFDAVHGTQRHFGPGRLADMYEEMGGSVLRIGKPSAATFQSAMQITGIEAPAERILMIGDSLFHDIAGARHAGIKSLLVTTGLYQDAFAPYDIGSPQWYNILRQKCNDVGVTPDYCAVSLAV